MSEEEKKRIALGNGLRSALEVHTRAIVGCAVNYMRDSGIPVTDDKAREFGVDLTGFVADRVGEIVSADYSKDDNVYAALAELGDRILAVISSSGAGLSDVKTSNFRRALRENLMRKMGIRDIPTPAQARGLAGFLDELRVVDRTSDIGGYCNNEGRSTRFLRVAEDPVREYIICASCLGSFEEVRRTGGARIRP